MLAVLLYTIQIYADFSGVMDIVRGVARLFGIQMALNFRRPFFSTSVQEFWRRWHISLGSWFRDYIYIPLGGSRVSTGRHIRNILWYGHSPVSGMAPAGTLCSGVFTTVSFFWQRNSFLDVFLRKLLSGFAIYIPCLP